MNVLYSMTFTFAACDQDFISTTNIKSKNGTFSAPVFLNPEGHVRQCTYNFRALPGKEQKERKFYKKNHSFRRESTGCI